MKQKEILFCLEYIKDFNGARAARDAGYADSPGGAAAVMASQLLRNPNISAFIESAKAERNKTIKIDAAYVLNRLRDIDQMKVSDIMNDDGSVKAISQWPLVWQQSVEAIDVQEVIRSGNLEGFVKKIKKPNVSKTLELIGKHIGVQAFRDKLDLSNDDGSLSKLSDQQLDAALERLQRADSDEL